MIKPCKHSWYLKDLEKVPKNGKTVFSAFHCGGGSSMGYKLAGYNVLGGVEIDKDMMTIYRKNFNPVRSYLMGVQDFNKIPNDELPKELFNLDILDGSPPCSNFSLSGNREKDWGKEKYFREGQAKQVLDDLFFHFIDMADKLQPKVIVAENVKGLLIGAAKGYVKMILQQFKEIGYEVQMFLLNSAFMEVPQRRERVFFIAHKTGKRLQLDFNYKPIPCKDVVLHDRSGKDLSKAAAYTTWKRVKPGQSLSHGHPKGSYFNWYRIDGNQPFPTLASGSWGCQMYWDEPYGFAPMDFTRIQSFPDDYDYGKEEAGYVCGMSVPPKMMMHIAKEIEIQLLS